eukprot:TRINITY_DN7900_c0_g1_i6.p2 TRINITY_DN7900_c0_g1~~TRINITY_DN7900_c0_g1_i6.p2  ORF type:complete len:117 (+),score=39.77 TRINITY_DN7900_c0_g1_i6:176-526(+)
MTPVQFRSIISYVGFPMPNKHERETVSILAFVDVEENYSLEQLEDMGSKDYIKFLDTKAAKKLIPYNPSYELPDIKKILETDKVLLEVEKEFKELDEMSKKKDKTHHILKNPEKTH